MISIIIATYTSEKTIERCLNSIIDQDQLVEIIIIDGNSSDLTLDIVANFRRENLICISEPDSGIYDAWNKGLKLATGNWIMFLGSDDMLIPKALEVYYSYLNNLDATNIDLLSAKCQLIDESGKTVKIWGKPYNSHEFKRYMEISHGSTLHNKKIFEELGQFNINYKICGDYDFLLRKEFDSFFIDKVLIKMQLGGASTKYASIKEAFIVRQANNSVNLFINIYILLKGLISLTVNKLLLKI